MNAADFPVTFPYGATEFPYGTAAFPYHRGEDRYMPEGTPIPVNGVQIGYSGSTGMVTGPHLHTGKWLGGKDLNPNGGGFEIPAPAKVTQVAWDAVNGNYVAIVDARGVRWVYLHMQAQTCHVGQIIEKGDDMASTIGEVEFNNLFVGFFGPITDDNPVKESDRKAWINQESNTVIRGMFADPRREEFAGGSEGEFVETKVYIKK
jgi:hypothetical protein